MKCPICGQPVEGMDSNKYFPFCSDRCKLIDLGRWMDGKYQIPVVEEDDEEISGIYPPPKEDKRDGGRGR